MTDDRNGGLIDRLKDAVAGFSGQSDDALTGSDAVAGVPTNVEGAAGNTVSDPNAGSAGSDESDAPPGPGEGGIEDILPGGPAPGSGD